MIRVAFAVPASAKAKQEILAARERRTMNEMIAEALEDLFNNHTG